MAPALLITLLFIAAPQALMIWTAGSLRSAEDYERIMSAGLIPVVGGSIGVILIWVAAVAGQTALVHLAMNAQQRKPFSFGDSMLTGWRLFLPTLGISLLTSLGAALGLILLIVPGIILMVMWCVSMPARIHDGPGVVEAMQESAALTKGVRWQVFAMLLIVGIGLYIISLLGTAPVLAAPEAAKVILGVVQPLTVGFSTLVTTFGTASLFHELKWGDRDPSEDLTAAIFA